MCKTKTASHWRTHTARTYVSWGSVPVSVLVELPGSHGIHLDEGDAPAAPLPLRLVDGEEGLKEQIHDTLGDRLGIGGQTGQQVVHAAHVPELEGERQTASGSYEQERREMQVSFHSERTTVASSIKQKQTHHTPYLGRSYCLDLEQHVKESDADFLRGVVEAVLERGQEFLQQWVAEAVVQDDGQTLGEASHKPQAIQYPVYCQQHQLCNNKSKE